MTSAVQGRRQKFFSGGGEGGEGGAGRCGRVSFCAVYAMAKKKFRGGGTGPVCPPPGYATGAVCKEFFFVILNSGILCAKTMMILLFLTSWDAL